MVSEPKRLPLALLPTPLHRLNGLSEMLGVDLWIKRDDLTGFAMGGNKARKLEYLMAEIVESGYDAVVTCGSTQSNFVRQLGTACAMHGVACIAVVMDLPFPDGGEAPIYLGGGHEGGNLVLDQLANVQIDRIEDGPWSALELRAAMVSQDLRTKGHRVYEIPIGGSTPLGAFGFWKAGQELAAQADPFDFIVTASSSGSTQAGLGHYFHGSSTRVVGVSADDEPEIVDDIVTLARGLDRLTGQDKRMSKSDFDFRLDYAFPGYGVPSMETWDAIHLMLHREGIVLDPVYSGKAFFGLLHMVDQLGMQGRILFWHTGGMPSLFTHSHVD